MIQASSFIQRSKSFAITLCILITTLFISLNSFAETKIESKKWDSVEGNDVYIYTLTNDNGMQVQLTNWGAYVTSIKVADKNGTLTEVTLGYNSAQKYVQDCCYSGATVGRYANRIFQGELVIEGKQYQLTTNNGKGDIKNHLHGGTKGFNKHLWNAIVIEDRVEMTLKSVDGDQGYPGDLAVKAVFTLNKNNEFSISYEAKTTKATPVNLVSHIYFNLSGNTAQNIESHTLAINAQSVVEVQENLIPTGKLVPVNNSVFDFRSPELLSNKLYTENAQMLLAGGLDKQYGGFDHTWVLPNPGELEKKVPDAILYERKTNILLKIFTTQPGMHIYTGNFMNGTNMGRNNKPYIFRNGIALETQNFADAPNQKNFPNSILEPDDVYKQTTVYKFGINSINRVRSK